MSRAAAGPVEGDGAEGVRDMFSRIAPTYDLLNTLLSLGLDERWRREAAREAVGGGARDVLDVATGTGKLAFAVKAACPACAVTGVDFAEPMLDRAREAAARRSSGVAFRVADGTALPFPDASFDAVTIGYGLRNFVDVDAGLREFRRVLRPGGRLVVLEFAPPPAGPVGRAFRLYFERVLPWVGGVVSGARGAYGYLPRSVKAFLPPEGLKDRMEGAGFRGVYYRLQTFGVSALHVGLAGDAPHGG